MKKTRTIFAGTPSFAIPSLELLEKREDIDLIGVYTQPDRPAGRGKGIQESAVKISAKRLEVPIYQPTGLASEERLIEFRSMKPTLLIVAAYGLIIPKEILQIPNYCLNVHASLLPRWRGAAPIHRAIMHGDQKTGISIMRIVEQLDAGPVLTARESLIRDSDTTPTLNDRLALIGADSLDHVISNVLNGKISETEQENGRVTYAQKISANDLPLTWSRPARELNCQIRALTPKPGATTTLGGMKLKILATELTDQSCGNPPGSISRADKTILQVATGTTDLRITTLQMPGKKAMSAKDFLNGYRRLL